MKVTTIASVLCLAATQLVAADVVVTSTATNTITKTVYRVTAETATESLSATPLASSPSSTGSIASSHAHHASAASTSSTSSTNTASPSATLNSAAGSIAANKPVALVAGSLALLLGYL
ncbi:hypothetical protein BDV30DRAFT_217976 [Aspergillus minisclerotigenes]|uniref:Uncharacterized protein n=1 Tax=Aspergillus minisclerotigenes TaxID=656917 RepID=A0A5N6IS51_9EURO|nr:hypothetical protein BDV30DRAFT_217976 [Aspergillus minisclerotigenes]